MTRFITDLCCNLTAGLRLAFFLNVRVWDFRIRFSQALALLLISFLLPFLQDYLLTLPDNRFNPFGLSYQATLYFLFLLSVFVLSGLQGDFTQALKTIILFLAVVPTVWTVCVLVDALGEHQQVLMPAQTEWAVFILYIAWYLSVILRAMFRVFHAAPARNLLLISVYALINIPALFYIPSQPLWYAIEPPVADQSHAITPLNIEETYYVQEDLLALQAGSMSRHTPGRIDMYFLGFAGYAGEDVFKNETLFVRRLMEQNYTGPGNAMVLINNHATATKYPMANRFNLERALRIIAGRIDTEEDIVFLFLTSHGSEDRRLSVQFPPLGLNDITPIQLHNAVLGAGIKWKVIIISSCYSGGFIDGLRDPYTLLITAAAQDRNSFGCGHDGRFTYFGEAFFNYALGQTRSLVEAFHLASERISQREQEEGHKPSNPRIVIGEKIQAKLEQYYTGIDQTGP